MCDLDWQMCSKLGNTTSLYIFKVLLVYLLTRKTMINHWISGYPIFRPNILAIFGPCLPKHMPFPRRIHLLNPYGSRTLPQPEAPEAEHPKLHPCEEPLGRIRPAQLPATRAEVVPRFRLVRTWDGENHGLPILSYGSYGLSQGKKRKTMENTDFLVDWHCFSKHFFELRQLDF